jgi:hypothetical protein
MVAGSVSRLRCVTLMTVQLFGTPVPREANSRRRLGQTGVESPGGENDSG